MVEGYVFDVFRYRMEVAGGVGYCHPGTTKSYSNTNASSYIIIFVMFVHEYIMNVHVKDKRSCFAVYYAAAPMRE
jgi:hypothetical protein